MFAPEGITTRPMEYAPMILPLIAMDGSDEASLYIEEEIQTGPYASTHKGVFSLFRKERRVVGHRAFVKTVNPKASFKEREKGAHLIEVGAKIMRHLEDNFSPQIHVPKFFGLWQVSQPEKFPGLIDPWFPQVLLTRFEKGKNLTSLLRVGSLTREQRYQIFLELTKTIEALHKSGVIHADITPSNILVAFDLGGKPKVRLVDFEISQLNHERDATAALFSTKKYAPPERRSHLGFSTDVYALGAILYELFSEEFGGRLPFGERNTLPRNNVPTLIRGSELSEDHLKRKITLLSFLNRQTGTDPFLTNMATLILKIIDSSSWERPSVSVVIRMFEELITNKEVLKPYERPFIRKTDYPYESHSVPLQEVRLF